ncbi:hypothetical protein Q7P37_007580 [Cladosporium fusiforme]
MREIPLTIYAAWPNPNYEDPVTRGDALLIINIIFIILVTLSIVVRLYSRVMVKCQSGMDDVMIVLAYIFTVGLTAAVLLANRRFGWDRHIWDLSPDMIQETAIVAFVAKLLFALASGFTRLSLIFLYYRLIRDTNATWYAWALHINLAFNVAIMVIFVLMCVFLCIPVQAYWQFPNVINGQCLDEGKVLLGSAVITCVADFLCTVLPIPAVMRLRMPLRERIGVCFLLSAGIVVTIAGSFRTYFIWLGLIAEYDETWFTYPLWICAAVEIHLSVICACVPAMKVVLWKPFRRWTSTMASHYRGTRTTNNFTESQDPINDSGYDHQSGYQLHTIEEKSSRYGAHQDLNMLEKAIAQLPPPGSHHPHQLKDTACVERCTENAKGRQDSGTMERAIAQLPPPGSHHPHQLKDKACVERCTENARARQGSNPLDRAIAQLPPPGSHHPHQLKDKACVERCTENARARQGSNPLDRAIAQLPPPGSHHPHQLKDTACVERCTENARAHAQRPLPPTRPPRSDQGITKETEFHVSRSEAWPLPHQKLPSPLPPGQGPHRPRHQPLIHSRRPSDVTPRGAGTMSTRRHAPAALPPTSPSPPPVAHHITSPLPPPTPLSRASSLSSQGSEFEMTAKKAKRKGRTFFFD